MASKVGNDTEDVLTAVLSAGVSASVRSNDSGGAMAAGQEDEPATYAGCSVSGCILNIVNWKRPFRTTALFAAINSLFWFAALSSYRAYCLLALFIALMVTIVTVKGVALSRSKGAHLWHSMTGSWEIVDSGQDSRAGTQFTDSWMSFKLFIQETSSFKQQNPGKFCLLVCSLCTFLAVLGRYIPGVIISYGLVLALFLWPLTSSHEFGLWLEPVLQKLDFGVGELLQKIKVNHEKRLLEAQTERENIEADLSSLFPKMDSTVCKEMSVSDTDVSDITWTENGTFNLSEGHTPQTENSEDLDREEVFIGGLPEFPSLDNGMGTNGEDDDDLSIGLPTPPPHPQYPISSKGEMLVQPVDASTQALKLVNKMASDAITAAVAAAIQERIEAAMGVTAVEPVRPRMPDPVTLAPLDLADDSESEVEDFELLDQSELEQLEGELGLGQKSQTKVEANPKPSKPTSSGGFFSKLLGRR
ncbi:reticulophagy regulator 1 isoform X1 [Hypomesus transpacificus]|uniref:reticulophagy regulator 1 isoform X1 n=1 Tax=Hypomesus transpacificus TaxID=137520 RepID=UPI001F07C2B3|nr:reticulophagy regulator 1 isoform X1 [Hypomesus transpacificus]